MVDKSTLGIIVFSSLVMLLTFRDLVTVKPPGDEDESNKSSQTLRTNENDELQQSKRVDEEPFKPIDDDFASSSSSSGDDQFKANFDPNSASGGGEFVKKIPSLKMKSNQQTLNFKFW
jgi:hypothetical protein